MPNCFIFYPSHWRFLSNEAVRSPLFGVLFSLPDMLLIYWVCDYFSLCSSKRFQRPVMPFSRTQLSLVSDKGAVGVSCGKFIFFLLFSAWVSLKPKATDFPLIYPSIGRQSYQLFELINQLFMSGQWPSVRPTVIATILFYRASCWEWHYDYYCKRQAF